MKKISAVLLALLFSTNVFASSVPGKKPFPYDNGVTLAKNVLYINARELSAGAGLGTLWSDTFKDSSQINAGSSSGYTYRGSSNFDVIKNTTAPSDRKLLLHLNGTDASTTFTDSSTGAKTVTAVGNAQLDTADKKFGTASLLLDGTGDCASLSDSADWEFGSNDFQFETFFKTNSTGITQTIFGMRESGGLNDLKIYIDTDNKLKVLAQRAGANVFSLMVSSTSISSGVWYHTAFYRVGNNFYLTLNGVQEATANTSGQMGTGTFTVRIGAYSTDSTENFNGWIDEMRVIKAATTYAAPPITVPTAELDDTTQAVVRSVATTFGASVSSLMVFVDMTLNTGSLSLVRVSANNGSTWKTISTSQLEEVVSLGHSGTQIILEVTFTGDAELEFWGVSA